MKAAVTERPGTMRIVDVPDADAPGESEVLVRPEAVGLCGSDFHYFLGHLGDAVGPDLYPRIQGHEFAGMIEAVGEGAPAALCRRTGRRVARDGVRALLPLPHRPPQRVLEHQPRRGPPTARCRSGSSPSRQPGVPRRRSRPAVSALIEPVSIAVRAIVRARSCWREGGRPRRRPDRPGGRGRRARPWRLRAARRPRREPCRARAPWAPTSSSSPTTPTSWRRAEWSGDEGPEVVFEATGVPELSRPPSASSRGRDAWSSSACRPITPRLSATSRSARSTWSASVAATGTSSPRRCRRRAAPGHALRPHHPRLLARRDAPWRSTMRSVILPRS